MLAKSSCVVVDGVTVGHPCCAQHNCKEPLQSQRDRYCQTHQILNKMCSIVGCFETVVEGHRVCAHPAHQGVEELYNLRGQSRFQLQERLQRTRMAGASTAGGGAASSGEIAVNSNDWDDADEDAFEIDPNGQALPAGSGPASQMPQAGSTPSRPATRVRAEFGRKRTHNEQIIVAPCGVIIARATFYGAEAIGSVAVISLYIFYSMKRLIHINFRNLSRIPTSTQTFPQIIYSSTTTAV